MLIEHQITHDTMEDSSCPGSRKQGSKLVIDTETGHVNLTGRSFDFNERWATTSVFGKVACPCHKTLQCYLTGKLTAVPLVDSFRQLSKKFGYRNSSRYILKIFKIIDELGVVNSMFYTESDIQHILWKILRGLGYDVRENSHHTLQIKNKNGRDVTVKILLHNSRGVSFSLSNPYMGSSYAVPSLHLPSLPPAGSADRTNWFVYLIRLALSIVIDETIRWDLARKETRYKRVLCAKLNDLVGEGVSVFTEQEEQEGSLSFSTTGISENEAKFLSLGFKRMMETICKRRKTLKQANGGSFGLTEIF